MKMRYWCLWCRWSVVFKTPYCAACGSVMSKEPTQDNEILNTIKSQLHQLKMHLK